MLAALGLGLRQLPDELLGAVREDAHVLEPGEVSGPTGRVDALGVRLVGSWLVSLRWAAVTLPVI
jgi:hypothetical protein